MTPLLIVDDDAANRVTLEALLEDEGFAVISTASIGEARARLAAGERFGGVLLDRNLDDGDGIELVPALRRALPAVKILLLTGANPEPEVRRAVDGVFIKSRPFAELADALRRLIV